MYSDLEYKLTVALVVGWLLLTFLAVLLSRFGRYGKNIAIGAFALLALAIALFPFLSIFNLASAIANPATEYISYRRGSDVVFSLASDPAIFWGHALITVMASCCILVLAIRLWRLRKRELQVPGRIAYLRYSPSCEWYVFEQSDDSLAVWHKDRRSNASFTRAQVQSMLQTGNLSSIPGFESRHHAQLERALLAWVAEKQGGTKAADHVASGAG
ncbi:hypothetical protein [Agrilutibacter solisilvae]|uniref:Uncharacterized protein n=1 Tax=Agrilutibacter solisilvae TaxID=2763317 RepID=A0A975ATU9_9GAMM|nr:hypothetical protein [Lysobacter solisilvae]QSX79390.1 hypothetical protein I8J32_005880 [Lysobacter solisilvae]